MDTVATYRVADFDKTILPRASVSRHFLFRWGNRRARLIIESILFGLAILLAIVWFSSQQHGLVAFFAGGTTSYRSAHLPGRRL
jgi:hypothetical protein